jgi:YD repeat-containing protein
MNFWATVKKVCGKEVTNESRHEFWFASRKDGVEYLQRAMSTINGNITDISYHETFGKPTFIRRNAESYVFEYYGNGQVKTKTSARARLTFEYDKTSRKVSKVKTEDLNDKLKVLATRSAEFRYDSKGNLVFAQNSGGQKVSMAYDGQGRILSITDQAKKLVKIEYEGKYGKPGKVSRPGLGSITVAYKQDGNIDKVTSPEGPTVAMQVASTFNNYLDVIAPATAEVFQ